MTQAEKLEALVQRAMQNGWDFRTYSYEGRDEWPTFYLDSEQYSPADILFDLGFARALFGSKIGNYLNKVLGEVVDPEWKYHLQQAVISKDPIDYYYKEVFGRSQ